MRKVLAQGLGVMKKIIKRIVAWLFYEVPTISFGQNVGTHVTGRPQLIWKYEINVSKNGRHVFATDSHIRNYHPEDITRLVELFTIAFPDCKIDVTRFSHRSPVAVEYDVISERAVLDFTTHADPVST
jgi:hypothetical protein